MRNSSIAQASNRVWVIFEVLVDGGDQGAVKLRARTLLISRPMMNGPHGLDRRVRPLEEKLSVGFRARRGEPISGQKLVDPRSRDDRGVKDCEGRSVVLEPLAVFGPPHGDE